MFNDVYVCPKILVIIRDQGILVPDVSVNMPISLEYILGRERGGMKVDNNSLDVTQKEYGVPNTGYGRVVRNCHDIGTNNFAVSYHD